MNKLSGWIFLFIFCYSSNTAWAFGKNKVITKNFNWKIEHTRHFDVFFYDNPGLNLLPFAVDYLENAYDKVTKILPDNPKGKFPFFLYNNHNEFEQTNIVDIGEGTGGVTEAFKNRFLVGNIGSQRYLKYVITHEFTHEIEFEYLFGQSWRSVQVLKIILYPNWLLEGLAEYTGGDADATVREMYVRDAATLHKLLPIDQLYSFNHVLPHQITLAYKESESFIRYLTEEYGQDKLPRILEVYQNKFDPDTVLIEVYGAGMSSLDRKFREYMEDKYAILANGLSEPDQYGKLLDDKKPYPNFFESAVFSPDGKVIAYISDQRGSKEIYIRSLYDNKTSRILDLAASIKVENVKTEGTGLAFSPDGKFLIFAGERQQKDYLYMMETSNGNIKEIDTHTDTVASPSFSRDGKIIFFSGIKNGFRDIYSFDFSNGILLQLTSGHMDEIDVCPSPDGKSIVYAAELETGQGIEYNLYRMNLATENIETITSSVGDERYPCFSADGEKLYFTSDEDGINDIYALDLKNNIKERLTKVIGGNFQPKVSPDGTKLLFSSFRNTRRELYLVDLSALPSLAKEGNEGSLSVTRNSPYPLFTKEGRTTSNAQPYRFRASTDLLLPVLFYSSLDGLYLATYVQMSELLGNHQLQSLVSYASSAEYIDYQITYGFLKYRPQFYFNFSGNEYFSDVNRALKRKRNQQVLNVNYPLNRYQRLEFLAGTVQRQDIFRDAPELSTNLRENIAGLSLVHDSTQGPYLEVTSGWRLKVGGDWSGEVLGGNFSYYDLFAENHQFIPLGKENVLGLRGFFAGSSGRDAGLFALGGSERVRGIPINETFAAKRIFVGNIEWRFPVVYNINYHMWYFFPDFFFKSLYGSLFVDSGLAWNDDKELENITTEQWKASYGVGVRVHTFILEAFPLLLNTQLALRMDDPSAIVVYFTLSSNF